MLCSCEPKNLQEKIQHFEQRDWSNSETAHREKAFKSHRSTAFDREEVVFVYIYKKYANLIFMSFGFGEMYVV